jgi:hypothetical protein
LKRHGSVLGLSRDPDCNDGGIGYFNRREILPPFQRIFARGGGLFTYAAS